MRVENLFNASNYAFGIFKLFFDITQLHDHHISIIIIKIQNEH